MDASRSSLAAYTGFMLRTATGAPAIPPEHIRDQFLPALTNHRLGNTVIVAPPESAKTTSIISFLSWSIGRDPSLHTSLMSETATQGHKRSVAIRDLVELDPRYQLVFPGARPDYVKGWAEGEWFLQRDNLADKDATMLAGGVGGAILGTRIDLGVLDDIAGRDNMATAEQRAKVIDWLERVYMTRISPRGRVIMIATRWHDSDPVAWAIKQGWHVVHVRALDEAGETYWPEHWPTYKLSCSGDHGQPMCYTDHVTGAPGNCKRRVLGTQGFLQQYQGEVHDEETSLLKRRWWRRAPRENMPAGARAGIFIDMAHGKGQENDFTAILVADADESNLYLREMYRVKVEFPELLRLVQRVRAEHPGHPVYIEQTPGSMPLIQQLRRQMAGVLPWRIEGRSKLERVHGSTPFVESGNVWVPSGAVWAEEFIEEAAAFPLGEHDDQVDVFTMACLRLLRPVVRVAPVKRRQIA